MDLLLPHSGTIIWMLLCFSIVLWVLKKFAWKPILNSLKSREDSIAEALKSAENARKEMEKLQTDNERIIAEAKLERDKIIKEARDLKNDIINEAKQKASGEADKIIEAAKEAIKNEKSVAIKEIKEQIANLSIDLAEKVIEEKLAAGSEQKDLIDKFIAEIKVN